MNIFDNIAANLSLKYENSEFYKNKLIKRYKPQQILAAEGFF